MFLERVTIGSVNASSNGIIYEDIEDVFSVWNGRYINVCHAHIIMHMQNYYPGSIPYDGVPRKENVTVHVAIYSIYIPLASAGIVFAIVCFIFNFLYREAKYVGL